MENEKQIKLVALIGFIFIFIFYLTQPVTVIIPLGNEHTDRIIINGTVLPTYEYNHSENPPIKWDDVQLNTAPLIKNYTVNYEYKTLFKNTTENNTTFLLEYKFARAIGIFTVRKYTSILHPDLKTYLGVSVPKYDNQGVKL